MNNKTFLLEYFFSLVISILLAALLLLIQIKYNINIGSGGDKSEVFFILSTLPFGNIIAIIFYEKLFVGNYKINTFGIILGLVFSFSGIFLGVLLFDIINPVIGIISTPCIVTLFGLLGLRIPGMKK
jgi:hypothetical protein